MNVIFSGNAKEEAKEKKPKRVAFCIPTVTKPYQCTLDSLAASIPLIEAAGYEHAAVYEIGNPYISAARSLMLHKALEWKADIVVFIDHDLSWQPEDLLYLIECDRDVVAATYRYKRDLEEYMGHVAVDIDGKPRFERVTIKSHIGDLDTNLLTMVNVPAGFLKITRAAVNHFMAQWPELLYGEKCAPHVDLFNHGAMDGVWYGEDYAFCRRWNERCGNVFCIPNLDVNHHLASGEVFAGNYDKYLSSLTG